METGISPAFDYDYWSLIYTKPWYHYNIQIGLGVILGILFNSYIEKRLHIDRGNAHENSLGYTVLKYIKKKLVVRTLIKVFGILIFGGCNIIQWTYVSSGRSWALGG